MEIVVLLVVVVITWSLASAQDNGTTLGEIFPRHQRNLHELFMMRLDEYDNVANIPDLKKLTLTNELINYTNTFRSAVALEFTWDLGNVTVQSIYESINTNCSTKIEDLRVDIKDTACAKSLLWNLMVPKLKHAVEDVLQKMSRDCTQNWPTLCSTQQRHCTLAYEDSVRSFQRGYHQFEDLRLIQTFTKPIDIVAQIVIITAESWNSCFASEVFFTWLEDLEEYSREASIPSLTIENVIRYWEFLYLCGKGGEQSCGRIAYYTAFFNPYMANYYSLSMTGSYMDLIACTLKDRAVKPLTWKTASSFYFNSPCLCVVLDGENCGIKASRGVAYCFSVLLGDLRRQITYRPAVTSLDFVFQSRIPLCNITKVLYYQVSSICGKSSGNEETSDLTLPGKCYFKDLVSQDLDCSDTETWNTSNNTVLCDVLKFLPLVLCEDDDKSFLVFYYKVQTFNSEVFLTCMDVGSRVLTLLSYLACPQLRNLPGKLMMCYLTTTLLRILVVHALQDYDLEWAVRLDVTLDLASTFWLTSYLHFLTTSIKTLRLPNSLSRSEVRQVLIRYSLLAWVLPLAMSSTSYLLDQILDTGIQFGQLFLVSCYYLALFANLYMFFHNCKFFYDVNSSVNSLGLSVHPRNIVADLINFALKTSVLSGAGITIRLLLMQIQSLDHLLIPYMIVGTLQGLLLFLLYGCCREARVFWSSLFQRLIGRCNCRNNNSLPRNSMELVEIPATQSLQNSSPS